MANKISIEEQVAQLTEEQQNKIVKVGKIATALQLIGGIPWLIMTVLGLWVLIDPPAYISYSDYDNMFKGLMVWLFMGAAYVIGTFVFAKLKCPYYSDAKCRYLMKKRKQR